MQVLNFRFESIFIYRLQLGELIEGVGGHCFLRWQPSEISVVDKTAQSIQRITIS